MVPRPLALLLIAVGITGLAWSLVSPPLQTPDEPAHYAYVQGIAERGELPGHDDERGFSTELSLASAAIDARQVAGLPLARPPWDEAAARRWERARRGISEADRSDGTGANAADLNPPLYYAWETPPYLLAGGDLFGRLTLMRIWSSLLLLVTTLATWLLAGELLGRNRSLQLLAAAAVGLHPMVAFISASLNPDSMLFALWALALWLGVRILRRGPRVGDLLGLALVTGLAVATKGVAIALVPGVLLVGTVAVARAMWSRREKAPPSVTRAAVIVGMAGAAGAVVAARFLPEQVQVGLPGGGSARELASYTWQFYLPRLPFQDDLVEGGPAFYEVWVQKGVGAFGWLEVLLPEPVYWIALAVGLAAAGGALVVVLRARRRGANPWPVAFLGLTTVVVLAGLHWTDYREFAETGQGLLQGRYLLPLAPVGAVALAAAASLLSPPRRALAAASLLAALVALQALSLAVTMERFYA